MHMEKSKEYICSNCGAAVTSEICPYCGSVTNVKTNEAYMEYSVLNCKEAALGFWTTVFPLIFAVMFTIAGITMLTIAISGMAEDGATPIIILMFIPFFLIGIAATVTVLMNVIRYMTLKRKGKHITGKFYGYADDNVRINGRPAQVAKILVDTPQGKRFIMYQLGSTEKSIAINQEVHLLVYKNIFMIEKNQEEITNW